MVNIPRWKVIAVLIVCALAFIYSAPNLVGSKAQNWMEVSLPSWLPTKTVNLGLDLQGGSHLLLQVDINTVLKERAEDLVSSARPELRSQKIGYRRIGVIPQGMRVTVRDNKDIDAVRAIIRDVDNGLEIKVDGDKVEATLSDEALKEITDQTIGQSIEIVRRRIDETGTNEPVIQRQGEDRILVQLPGVTAGGGGPGTGSRHDAGRPARRSRAGSSPPVPGDCRCGRCRDAVVRSDAGRRAGQNLGFRSRRLQTRVERQHGPGTGLPRRGGAADPLPRCGFGAGSCARSECRRGAASHAAECRPARPRATCRASRPTPRQSPSQSG